MHEAGLRMTNEQIRNGEVIRSGNVEHWDYQSGLAAIQQGSFTIQPGDSFRTTCYYEDPDGTRKFGYAATEEMCMAFFYYYPRQTFDLDGFSAAWFCGYDIPINPCQATYEKLALDSKEELNRQYAISNPRCEAVQPPLTDGQTSDEGDSGSYTLASSIGLAGVVVIGTLKTLLT